MPEHHVATDHERVDLVQMKRHAQLVDLLEQIIALLTTISHQLPDAMDD